MEGSARLVGGLVDDDEGAVVLLPPFATRPARAADSSWPRVVHSFRRRGTVTLQER